MLCQFYISNCYVKLDILCPGVVCLCSVPQVWNLTNCRLKTNHYGHSAFLNCVTVSPDGSLCASGGKVGRGGVGGREEEVVFLNCVRERKGREVGGGGMISSQASVPM